MNTITGYREVTATNIYPIVSLTFGPLSTSASEPKFNFILCIHYHGPHANQFLRLSLLSLLARALLFTLLFGSAGGKDARLLPLNVSGVLSGLRDYWRCQLSLFKPTEAVLCSHSHTTLSVSTSGLKWYGA